MESPLSFFRMHWVHEPTRNRSAGFPACGFTGHSCPVFLLRATGKSPEPADRNVCPTHPTVHGEPSFVFSACIGTMNLRIARQRLGLRQSSGAFGWLACIAKAPEVWRT